MNEVDTDKSRLDVASIHSYLCNQSYWAEGRSYQDVEKTIENSICFGIYNSENSMMGFARVVTDSVVFAYLMDVFILDEYQGLGLGKKLVTSILEHPELQVKFFLLGTVDAHEFYRKLGFDKLPNTERFMRLT